MNRLSIPLAIGAACSLLIAVGCFQTTEGATPFIEPCTPIDDSAVDPCLREPLWQMDSNQSASYAADAIPNSPIDLFTEMASMGEDSGRSGSPGLFTPQFYVRGTFVPGSARCSKASKIVKAAERSTKFFPAQPVIGGNATRDGFVWFNCFVDLRVNEYLNGDGPVKIPLLVYWGHAGEDES